MAIIDKMSEDDKLWQLYLHTLAGWHGNHTANGCDDLEEVALQAARDALGGWNKRSKRHVI